MPVMTTDRSASDEIDMDEAMRVSGKTRDALMKLKKRGRLSTRIVLAEQVQKNRKILFRRNEIEALAEQHE